ncbi:hypothetical protein [Stenotrophomonas sp.]|uniref:hypothetical protein n=1 Tax=Stenotrophomonas sp. TaxID=69392 RepID=UPI0028A9F3A1|nr:hypothetical protein [Stenotrophomonas sp.]
MTRMLRVVVLCVLGLGLAACGKLQEELAASQNPFPKSSPLHAPVDRVTRKLIHEPTYMARMKGLEPGKAREMGATLSMNGLGRLELPMLERRALLVGQLLEKLPEAQCGEIAKAVTPAQVSRTTDRMLETLATLPQGAIDEWFDIAYAATLAELQQRPKTQVTEAQVNASATALVELLPNDAERERIGRVMSNLPGATDADACWAVRTMYTTLPELPEPQRGHFAWASTQQ